MALMDYGRCRMYRLQLEWLRANHGVPVNWDAVNRYHSASQYAFLINEIISNDMFLNANRKNVIREMKAYASSRVVSGKYFNWMKAEDRVACYSLFWLVCNANPFFLGANLEYENQDTRKVSHSDDAFEMANGIKFQYIAPFGDSIDNYVFSSMVFIDNLEGDIAGKITLIENAYNSWSRHFSLFPRPFKWIDLNEGDNVLWLWDYMRKNHIGCDLLPSSSKQQKDFLLATFDNWAGWLNEQFSKQKENARRRANPEEPYSLKKLLNPTTPDDCRKVFLDNVRNAWGQRRHRQKVKKDTTGIKLTAQSRKKLLAIQQLSGVEPNAILKSLIDDAYKRIKEKNKD
ncbi:hypothetical protein OGV59_13830 [Citrobacter sp. CK187]|uniref:hypothetical protein n=1 Tax=Citrobacter sp. CK187 TaxID=2985096 RepID=UPI002577A270|nr:hypothetical protein [Citrobacter sp. CK187]MDM3013108.1 hypothetical protein [Citrobacter sp. CK187]